MITMMICVPGNQNVTAAVLPSLVQAPLWGAPDLSVCGAIELRQWWRLQLGLACWAGRGAE